MGCKPWGQRRCWRRSLGRVLVMGVLLAGCAPTETADTDVPAEPVAAPRLAVVTTFLPMTAFTKAVVGDRATVTQLVPANVDPHDFQARPQDVQAVAQAAVLVKNGLEIETFLEGLIKNANNPNLTVIDSSVGVATLAHEEDKAHSHDHDHEHGHKEAHDHEHRHGEFNPHIWLDPVRAIQQVETIRDGLTAVDAEGAATYAANAAAFIKQLRALDAEARAQLAPFAGKTFVVYHDLAPYFAERYNLKAEFLVGVPEASPAPEDVRRVMAAVQTSQLKTLLTEPGQEEVFASLAKDMGVSVSVFDPLETASSAADLTPAYFLATMRQNIRNLAAAFGARTQAYRSRGSVAVVWPVAALSFVYP
ncbi:zinc ABC transporter substrate-binding protein [Thermosynechococcaceae cyanobacterium Okahandja]